jgi:hypothetical protein
LVYQLQKLNGMEKKRRSRTRRDQPATNKPGQPYQKSHPHGRTSSSTNQPASPELPSSSPSRRRDTSRVLKAEVSPSYFDAPPPRTSADEYISPYSSATSPARSSSPSSPYYLSAGTSSFPGSRNISPLQASLPIPTPFDPFQRLALTSQSTPDSISPTSPGYHDLQSYGHGITGELRVEHPVSQTIPTDGSHLATFSDIYAPTRQPWNQYDRQQGRIELSAYPRSLPSHPSDLLAPRLAHRPEQTSTSFHPMSHGFDTPPVGNHGGNYFYPSYEDRIAGTSVQNVYLHGDRSPDADSSNAVPYYS